MIVDAEEEYYPEEVAKLAEDVKRHGLGLIVFGEWYNLDVQAKMRFFDDNTRSWWTPVTGERIVLMFPKQNPCSGGAALTCPMALLAHARHVPPAGVLPQHRILHLLLAHARHGSAMPLGSPLPKSFKQGSAVGGRENAATSAGAASNFQRQIARLHAAAVASRRHMRVPAEADTSLYVELEQATAMR